MPLWLDIVILGSYAAVSYGDTLIESGEKCGMQAFMTTGVVIILIALYGVLEPMVSFFADREPVEPIYEVESEEEADGVPQSPEPKSGVRVITMSMQSIWSGNIPQSIHVPNVLGKRLTRHIHRNISLRDRLLLDNVFYPFKQRSRECTIVCLLRDNLLLRVLHRRSIETMVRQSIRGKTHVTLQKHGNKLFYVHSPTGNIGSILAIRGAPVYLFNSRSEAGWLVYHSQRHLLSYNPISHHQ
jgi:hypothetical protein